MKPSLILLSALVTLQPVTAADAPATTDTAKKVTYATDMKPIFDATCASCHNANKPKAKVQMDTLEGVLKSGKKRKLVVPGKSADSHLVKLVESIAAAAKDPDGKTKATHKKGVKPLTPEQISQLKAWIDQGAT